MWLIPNIAHTTTTTTVVHKPMRVCAYFTTMLFDFDIQSATKRSNGLNGPLVWLTGIASN